MTDKITIFIVIPVFNGWVQTKQCIEALMSSTYDNIEIILVDHGSTDQTREQLPKHFPQVQHVLSDDSKWWAGATNIGINKALEQDARLIMLLNHDCYVKSDTISKLVEHSLCNPDAIIAPTQISLSTGRTTTTLRTCFLLGFPTISLFNSNNKTSRTNLRRTKLILGGRGVIIPAEIFTNIGIFDDVNLPHYGADHDFFIRSRKNGIALMIALDACVQIDDNNTSLASDPSLSDFSCLPMLLTNRKSHRNIKDQLVLFKRYYPIKGLHHVGLSLSIVRYLIVFIWRKLRSSTGHTS